ncbi:Golgi apparatus protein 1 [Bacillus rossius redtenbacheri]|uniref:Golgi apparatus protein 1 n=1 Tax=Bacillus rossius redtenbacheri TaxID=93214 RepID=UPI002FDCEAE5
MFAFRAVSFVYYIYIFSVLYFINCSNAESSKGHTSVSRSQRSIQTVNRNEVSKTKLINESECIADIKRLCGTLPPNSDDLFVLECIQSFKANELSSISEVCQHKIWVHTTDLVSDDNLVKLLDNACSQDSVVKKCSSSGGSLLACLIDRRESITYLPCKAFIQRLEWVVFSDFRTISSFVSECRASIEKFQCGRLPSEEPVSQGRTLACLQQRVDDLEPRCQKQVLHLSEVQADDIKLDRQLYLACQPDRLRLCPDIPPGSEDVYRCLMQHRLDRTLSAECHEQLLRRQKLIARDYKVSKGLARSCKEDIRLNHCRRLVSDDKEIRLAQILLCLEGVIRNGSKVSQDCQVEMVEHRKILMEDYRLSPEIVSQCSSDISKFCSGGLEVGGKTIHCLMDHVRPRKRKERVSSPCQRALEVLVKEADVGEDWRVDPVLREACRPVVQRSCRDIRGGDARVMTCLMEKLGTDYMTPDCEAALIEIQYFVVRDFKLDPQLYRRCREDAVKLCHAKKAWTDDGQMDPERGPLVLPCLYRYAYHAQDKMRLKAECLEEIRRVMRQRAVSVDLQPEVEEVCLENLASMCSDKVNKGEEMVCLQDNLESLTPECRQAVSNFTEEQARHVELNPVLTSTCQAVMEKHCAAVLQTGRDEGDVMECLVEHKNEPDVRSSYKCRAAIEHFQLISLKDYHFTYKFKEACRPHVIRYCPGARTKLEVITCLSEHVRNDTIHDAKHTIPRDCRQQLRAQLFQQRENINFDPGLRGACFLDIKKFCPGTVEGAGQILECLQINVKNLSPDCHKAIFNVEKQELLDSSSDYVLITKCRQMIRQFCHEEDQSHALECLKRFKDEMTFDPKCKVVVVRRMIEQNQDYRFNPLLQKGCHLDIPKFCADVVASEPQDKELEGKVIKCLKVKFRERKLRTECELQMATILREAALNYHLNPLLAAVCKEEINTMCKGSEDEDGSGEVEECLKNAFHSHRPMKPSCREEVAGIIEDAKADIHVDPLLHQACGVDVTKFCGDIPQGAGRHIQCLQNVLQDSTKSLQPKCEEMLTKRIEMFKYAALVVDPQNIHELYTQVANSPARRYFLIVSLTIVGLIFIMGLFCGRATKRTLLMKNK